jgi:hypothetical protein
VVFVSKRESSDLHFNGNGKNFALDSPRRVKEKRKNESTKWFNVFLLSIFYYHFE